MANFEPSYLCHFWMKMQSFCAHFLNYSKLTQLLSLDPCYYQESLLSLKSKLKLRFSSRNVKWTQYKSLLVIRLHSKRIFIVENKSIFRHPLERLESLYANKFTNIQEHEQSNSSGICPGIPFRRLVRNIISKRTKDPGSMFRYSLTPNEFVTKVDTQFEYHYNFSYYRFILGNIKGAGSAGTN